MPLLGQDYPTRVRLNRLRSRVAGYGKHFGFATTDVANVLHEESDRYLLQELVDHLRGRVGHPPEGAEAAAAAWTGLTPTPANATRMWQEGLAEMSGWGRWTAWE